LFLIIAHGGIEEENTVVAKITFAQRLKELRAAAGLTQAEFAKRAGMYRIAVARLECGTQGPAWESVKALARALGMTVLAFDPPEETAAKKRGTRKS
jgi:transcriptional regulator with XRE-family HTH domain